MTYEIRERALEFAITATPLEAGPHQVVSAAKLFADFLGGRDPGPPEAETDSALVASAFVQEAVDFLAYNEALVHELFRDPPSAEDLEALAPHFYPTEADWATESTDEITVAIQAIADAPPEARDASDAPEATDEDVLVLEAAHRKPDAPAGPFDWLGINRAWRKDAV